MPERQPNQFARIAAVLALGAAFVLVVFTIATTGGSDDNGDNGGDGGEAVANEGPTEKGQRAIDNGVWVVGEGDTLVSISEETGIELEELLDLNPEIDAQALITGQRISLRAGTAGEGTDGDTDTTDTQLDAGDTPSSGTGEGDGGPSGTTTNESFGD